MKLKRAAPFVMCVAAVSGVVAIAAWCVIIHSYQVIPPGQTGITIVVPPKASIRSITKMLMPEQNLMVQGSFGLLTRYCSLWRHVLPTLPASTRCSVRYGRYQIQGPATPMELLRKISEGPRTTRVVVPEGFDLQKIGRTLERAGICTAAKFLRAAQDRALAKSLTHLDLDSLEGYLGPDTYVFALDTPATIVLKTMAKERASTMPRALAARARDLGLRPVDIVILASIIEKESGVDDHRYVSAVFHNRLRLHWKLESCATAIYAAGPRFKGKLRRSDLNSLSPFNTYQHFGLPPAPICSPGRKSLEAALNPADSEYLFFVSRNDGTHEFSASRAEHERWACKFQGVDCPKQAVRDATSDIAGVH